MIVSTGKESRMISAVHVGGKEAETFDFLNIPWMQRGACRGTKDPDKFFRKRGSKDTDSRQGQARKANTTDAKEICARCKVSSQCLLWALEHDEEYGIWGGSTPDERQIMKRYL